MSLFENSEVAVNMELFKILGYYHILDSNFAKHTHNIFNYRFYRLIIVVITAIMLCINCFGMLGYIIKVDDVVNEISSLQLIIAHITYFQSALKLSVFVYNADKFWDLLDVTRIHFLTSQPCYRHINILIAHRDKLIKITNFIFIMINITIFIWLVVPVFSNMIRSDEDHRRYNNVFNLRFPVFTNVYNEYYFIFYIFEGLLGIYVAYVMLIFDVFSTSISYILIC